MEHKRHFRQQLSLFAVLLLAFTGANAQVYLDDFTTPTTLGTGTSTSAGNYTVATTTTGAGIMGGERDVYWNFTQVLGGNPNSNMTLGSVPGTKYYAASPIAGLITNYAIITWDGADGNAAAVDATTGLGGLNMTGAGNFATTLMSDALGAGYYCTTTYRVYSSPTHFSEATHTLNGPIASAGPDIPISFILANFTTGAGAAGPADFTKVTAVQMITSTNQHGYDYAYYGGMPIPASPVISGTVFNDPDAGNVNNSSGVANAVPTGMYANLVDVQGKVVATTTVAADGTYSFAGISIAGGDYNVVISLTQGTINQPAPSSILPANWSSTGEFNGLPNTGNDGNVNGTSAVFTLGATDVTNINMGIKTVSGNALSALLENLSATINNGHLLVTWTTLSEKNVAHFDIEVSGDGKTFSTVQRVNSKAINGNATEAINYSADIPVQDVAAVLSVLAFTLLLGKGRQRRQWRTLGLALVAVASLGVACTKNDTSVTDKNSKVYVRIATVDKDGATDYSKVIQLANQ